VHPVTVGVRSWLAQALPWWIANAWDKTQGGFIEQFDMAGKDAGAGFRRTRVAARQVYAFCHAHMLGVPGAAEAASTGVRYILGNGWARGVPRRLSRSGEVIDATPDLYDHAFLAFALAWRCKAFADPDARDALNSLFDHIEDVFTHPAGGYAHEAPMSGWRQQNPHMHLTEACLVAYEATGQARFSELAGALISLFRSSFFDLKSGTLAEFFTEDWRRAPGDAGRHVEPGHQMEWAWILSEARRLLPVRPDEEIRALVAFAEKFGVDPVTHAVYNVVRDDGAPLDQGSRTWPNTERLKAAVALFELDGTDPTGVFETTLGLLFGRYLATETPGLWIDAFDAGGRPLAQTVPSSTLYHLLLAFAEVLRAGEKLR